VSRIRSIRLLDVTRPLKITFSTASGRKDFMQSVIVKVELENGSLGHGECPTSFTLRHETVPAIKAFIKTVSPELRGMPIGEYPWLVEKFRKTYATRPMTVSGLEVALFRAFLSNQGIAERAWWGGVERRIQTDITIPFVPDHPQMRSWVERMVGEGFTTFKIKVSGNLDQDKRFLTTVCNVLDEGGRTFTLRLDGNQGYTAATYLRMADFVLGLSHPVQLFEQPLKKDDEKGLKSIKGRSPIPIVLDETVFTGEDMNRVIESDLAHGVNIKIAKSGISESGRILAAAQKHGIRLMLGCMTETMIGLSAGIYMAAGVGNFDFMDLDSIHFLHHKNRYGLLEIQGSRFICRD
jgi:L-Ala-D/L-Glu epimerase